jgi:hypothetical protein
MIDPILGGFLRILSVNPEPTLKSCVAPEVNEVEDNEEWTHFSRFHFAL